MFTVTNLIETFDRQLQASVSAGTKAEATRDWYFWQLKKLKAAAGSLPAAELRVWHLNEVKITNHFARALRALYGWASDNDLTPKNPFLKLQIPKAGQRERTVSRAELTKLYLACNRQYRRYLFLLAHTMCRPSEIRLLKIEDIDVKNRVIILTDFKGKKARMDGIKARVIPLDRSAVMLITAMLRQGKGPYLFGGLKPWSYTSVRSAMRRARLKAGLNTEGERVVCYTLRHTGATNAMRAGIQTTLLAKIMGHAKVTTTQRYQHPTSVDMVEAIDAIHDRKHR